MRYLGVYGSNFEKLLSYLISKLSNLSYPGLKQVSPSSKHRTIDCVKSVQIRTFFWSVKYRPEKTQYLDIFHAVIDTQIKISAAPQNAVVMRNL